MDDTPTTLLVAERDTRAPARSCSTTWPPTATRPSRPGRGGDAPEATQPRAGSAPAGADRRGPGGLGLTAGDPLGRRRRRSHGAGGRARRRGWGGRRAACLRGGLRPLRPEAVLVPRAPRARARVYGRAADWRMPRRLVVGALAVDRDARSALHAGREVALNRKEFEFHAHMAAQPTRVLSKWELLRDVWGYRAKGSTRTVDAHACRLRRKLALAGAPHLVQNVHGVGYRLSVAAVPPRAKPEAVAAPSHNGHAA
jgi:DNA-binding winged helix-turn-helix (wHTH) protein